MDKIKKFFAFLTKTAGFLLMLFLVAGLLVGAGNLYLKVIQGDMYFSDFAASAYDYSYKPVIDFLMKTWDQAAVYWQDLIQR